MQMDNLRKEIDKLEKQREMVKSNKIQVVYNPNYEKTKKDNIIKTLKEEIKSLKQSNLVLQDKILLLQNENTELKKKKPYNKNNEIGKIKSKEYQNFREKVLYRDNYICQQCGSKNKLQVHHIKSRKERPDLIMNMDNCVTLCIVCHAKTDNYFS